VWHSPRLLNAAADALYCVAAAIAVWIAVEAALRAPFMPVRAVALTGDLRHVDAERVRASLEGRLAGNFFGVELADVRRALEALPWVRHAEVRREWPDRLIARIEEHVVLARWPGGKLLSTTGEVFEGEGPPGPLPQLAGPPGTEREVARRFRAFRELLAPLGAEPVRVQLSARRAWQIQLADGLVLELGRDQARQTLEERLARFVAAYPRIAAELERRPEHIDLRYPNGFAIRIPGSAAAQTEARPQNRGT
jgi:cell division protein FtsQ